VEYIQSLSESTAVAQAYSYLVIDLFSNKKVREMIFIGRAGIQYCLTKSQELSQANKKKADWFRTNAQIMSFNLAANTWPGWGDEGISLSKEDQEFGLEMAFLDLRLATELNYPAPKISNSYWIIGAQSMALKKYEEAFAAFEEARKKALEAGDEDQLWMIKGYTAITEIMAKKENGQTHFDEAVKFLKTSTGEDAQFFAQQLESVLKQFSTP
jgi:tetratricopeptide (TPR) repeat protein